MFEIVLFFVEHNFTRCLTYFLLYSNKNVLETLFYVTQELRTYENDDLRADLPTLNSL